MAISAPAKSAQYTNYTASPQTFVPSSDWGSKIRASFSKLTFTAAGFTTAALGDIALIRMPAGPVRIFPDLCRLVCPVGTVTSDLDIGISAYKGADGVTVAWLGLPWRTVWTWAVVPWIRRSLCPRSRACWKSIHKRASTSCVPLTPRTVRRQGICT